MFIAFCGVCLFLGVLKICATGWFGSAIERAESSQNLSGSNNNLNLLERWRTGSERERNWVIERENNRGFERKREIEVHDKNHDGFVSFFKYESPSWVHSAANNSFGYDMGWWREEHFNASDADGDGLLNLIEFNDFQHPADSKNPKLLQWLCKEEVRERDTDRDGKIKFKEFFHGLFDLVRNYDEESYHGSHQSDNSVDAPARTLFGQLDKDGDGYLSDVELLPVIGKIHPSERYYAKQQADYIITQDENGSIEGCFWISLKTSTPLVRGVVCKVSMWIVLNTLYGGRLLWDGSNCTLMVRAREEQWRQHMVVSFVMIQELD